MWKQNLDNLPGGWKLFEPPQLLLSPSLLLPKLTESGHAKSRLFLEHFLHKFKILQSFYSQFVILNCSYLHLCMKSIMRFHFNIFKSLLSVWQAPVTWVETGFRIWQFCGKRSRLDQILWHIPDMCLIIYDGRTQVSLLIYVSPPCQIHDLSVSMSDYAIFNWFVKDQHCNGISHVWQAMHAKLVSIKAGSLIW